MEVISPLSSTVVARHPGLGGHMLTLPGRGELSVHILRSSADRLLIAPLRQYADCGSEYELDPGMAALEQKKDSLGVVMAFMQDGLPVATIRVIPSGHGVTLTERYWGHIAAGTEVLGPNSWELGRLVVAPEHRRADLFPACMSLAMQEFLDHEEVEHLHGSCLVRMTRLYRRFGFGVVGTSTSGSGKECALIHARAQDVARALKLTVGMPAAVLQ